MKKDVPIRPFWYSDAWIFPKLVTIVTTLDAEGKINAAPYSHIMQFDVMHKRPRIMVGFRQDSHTFRNIEATGEFVINCPSSEYLEDIMETARFYPDGVNELEHTRFTTLPSLRVKPPSIEQCPQIMECTVDEIVRLPQSSGIVYGNIVSIVMDEGLEEMDRGERIPAMNLPIGLGDQDRMEYYFARTTDVLHYTLKETPRGHLAAKITTSLEWDEDAMQGLMQIPPPVRPMVTEQVETYAKGKGASTVTLTHMEELMAEFGMDRAVMARFDAKTGQDADTGQPEAGDAEAKMPAGADATGSKKAESKKAESKKAESKKAESKKAESIRAEAAKLAPALTFTTEACEALTAVPRPFVKKALRGIVARAEAEGLTVVDGTFVARARDERG